MEHQDKRPQKGRKMRYKGLFVVALLCRAPKLYGEIIGACSAFAAGMVTIAGRLPIHSSWMAAGVQIGSLAVMCAILAVLSKTFAREMRDIKSAAQARKLIPNWVKTLLPAARQR